MKCVPLRSLYIKKNPILNRQTTNDCSVLTLKVVEFFGMVLTIHIAND